MFETRFRFCLIVGLVAVLPLGAGVAQAASPGGWRALADIVFRPVAQEPGQAAILMPTAIAQDGQGFLWAAGEAGLARWDGYGLRFYRAEGSRPDGLPDHNVLSLHRDAAGRLWVGTVTGGLARYDPAGDRFVPVPLDDGAGPARCVWSIDDDAAGGLWIATSTGLFHIDSTGQVLARLRHDPARVGSLPDDKVQAVLRDRAGTLWVGGRAGLARAAGGQDRFVAVKLPAAAGEPPEISRLMQDSAGHIWAGSRGQGAFVIGQAGDRATAIAATAPAPGGAAAPEIMAMAEIGASHVWLGTFGSGVVDIDTASLAARRLLHNPFVPGSLQTNTVTALYRDDSGLAWVGTSQGLATHDPGNTGILTMLGSAGRTDGLKLGDVSAVLARPDGRLWLGSEADGVQILDPAGTQDHTLAVPRVFSLAAGATGPVMIGTRGGLYAADANAGALAALDLAPRPAKAPVNALLMDDGVLWLGGGEDGLWELHPRPEGGLAVARHIDRPKLTNGTVRAIAIAPDGRLAVGTDDGFNLLDRNTGAIEAIRPNARDAEGLGPGAVMCFAADRQHRLWVGTDSSGIDVLIGRDPAGHPRFHHIGRADGLPNADISKMLVGGNGMVWASTDDGLAEIDPESFAVRIWQAPDGVVVNAYWSNSGAITPQGDLVFGGLGGITIVQPDRTAAWRYLPPLAITDIRVGGHRVAAVPPPGGVLTIPPDADSLSVEFSALDFSAPELNRYSYRLDGFDPAWVETDAAHRVATYMNLSPGDYTLRLRGSNRAGVWATQTLALHLRVLPAWFQTAWFRLAEIAAAVLVVGMLVQGRTLILRRRAQELERQVAERTAELSASKTTLQQFAYFDSLTALPNRRAFNDHILTLLQASPPESFALVLVDLDGFKKVNDALGHQAGDQLLVLAAGRMRDAVRESDFIARLGGDEFAILIRPVPDPSLVDGLCERIVRAMGMPFGIKGSFVDIGASSGAALFPQHGRQQDDLYRHADLALYQAKRAGRGAWRWYTGTLPSAADNLG